MKNFAIRTKYVDLSMIKGFLLGVGYDEQELIFIIGPFLLTIKLFMFNRSRKPSTF